MENGFKKSSVSTSFEDEMERAQRLINVSPEEVDALIESVPELRDKMNRLMARSSPAANMPDERINELADAEGAALHPYTMLPEPGVAQKTLSSAAGGAARLGTQAIGYASGIPSQTRDTLSAITGKLGEVVGSAGAGLPEAVAMAGELGSQAYEDPSKFAGETQSALADYDGLWRGVKSKFSTTELPPDAPVSEKVGAAAFDLAAPFVAGVLGSYGAPAWLVSTIAASPDVADLWSQLEKMPDIASKIFQGAQTGNMEDAIRGIDELSARRMGYAFASMGGSELVKKLAGDWGEQPRFGESTPGSRQGQPAVQDPNAALVPMKQSELDIAQSSPRVDQYDPGVMDPAAPFYPPALRPESNIEAPMPKESGLSTSSPSRLQPNFVDAKFTEVIPREARGPSDDFVMRERGAPDVMEAGAATDLPGELGRMPSPRRLPPGDTIGVDQSISRQEIQQGQSTRWNDRPAGVPKEIRYDDIVWDKDAGDFVYKNPEFGHKVPDSILRKLKDRTSVTELDKRIGRDTADALAPEPALTPKSKTETSQMAVEPAIEPPANLRSIDESARILSEAPKRPEISDEQVQRRAREPAPSEVELEVEGKTQANDTTPDGLVPGEKAVQETVEDAVPEKASALDPEATPAPEVEPAIRPEIASLEAAGEAIVPEVPKGKKGKKSLGTVKVRYSDGVRNLSYDRMFDDNGTVKHKSIRGNIRDVPDSIATEWRRRTANATSKASQAGKWEKMSDDGPLPKEKLVQGAEPNQQPSVRQAVADSDPLASPIRETPEAGKINPEHPTGFMEWLSDPIYQKAAKNAPPEFHEKFSKFDDTYKMVANLKDRDSRAFLDTVRGASDELINNGRRYINGELDSSKLNAADRRIVEDVRGLLREWAKRKKEVNPEFEARENYFPHVQEPVPWPSADLGYDFHKMRSVDPHMLHRSGLITRPDDNLIRAMLSYINSHYNKGNGGLYQSMSELQDAVGKINDSSLQKGVKGLVDRITGEAMRSPAMDRTAEWVGLGLERMFGEPGSADKIKGLSDAFRDAQGRMLEVSRKPKATQAEIGAAFTAYDSARNALGDAVRGSYASLPFEIMGNNPFNKMVNGLLGNMALSGMVFKPMLLADQFAQVAESAWQGYSLEGRGALAGLATGLKRAFDNTLGKVMGSEGFNKTVDTLLSPKPEDVAFYESIRDRIDLNIHSALEGTLKSQASTAYTKTGKMAERIAEFGRSVGEVGMAWLTIGDPMVRAHNAMLAKTWFDNAVKGTRSASEIGVELFRLDGDMPNVRKKIEGLINSGDIAKARETYALEYVIPVLSDQYGLTSASMAQLEYGALGQALGQFTTFPRHRAARIIRKFANGDFKPLVTNLIATTVIAGVVRKVMNEINEAYPEAEESPIGGKSLRSMRESAVSRYSWFNAVPIPTDMFITNMKKALMQDEQTKKNVSDYFDTGDSSHLQKAGGRWVRTASEMTSPMFTAGWQLWDTFDKATNYESERAKREKTRAQKVKSDAKKAKEAARVARLTDEQRTAEEKKKARDAADRAKRKAKKEESEARIEARDARLAAAKGKK